MDSGQVFLGTGKAAPETDVRLDIQRLIETRLLIQANSGGGKSWALRRILELSHQSVQQIVIDPEGEFGTLRESYDYVLAGEDGDCAAEPRSAALLARKLLELRVSAICNIYELKQHERLEFVRRFLEALIDAPKRLWRPVLIVLDEAHVYCPERGQAASAGAVIDLATRGRKRGMCAVLATQRLSKLRKDAAAELNNVLIGRTGLDVDLARAADSLGLSGKNDRQKLRYLRPGEFYGFGPALPDGITLMRVGKVVTSHPQTGGRIALTPPPPTARIRKMLAELADLPGTAEIERQTIDSLQRENRSLQAKIKRAEGKGQKEVQALLEGTQAKLKQAMESDRESISRVLQWESYGGQLEERIGQALLVDRPGYLPGPAVENEARAANPPRQNTAVPASKAALVAKQSPQRVKPKTDTSIHVDVSRPQQAILDGLARLAAMGTFPARRANVAVLAGTTVKSSGFTNNLGRLRSLGLIEYPAGGYVLLTKAGENMAAPVDSPATRTDLRERWIESVSVPQARILRALFDSWPSPVDRAKLATKAGTTPASSGFTNNLGRLRSFGLLDYTGESSGYGRPVRATDQLFGEAGND